MAMVLDACTEVAYLFRDREDTRTRMQVHFNQIGAGVPALTLDTLEQAAIGTLGPFVPGGLWVAVQDLSDCPIVGASLSAGYHEDSAILNAGAGEAESKGNYQFEDANGEFFTVTVPGPLDAILDSNGRFINPANAAVAAFVSAMLDQTGAADIRTANNLVPVRLAEAWKSHRNSSKTSGRRTG